MNVEELKFDWPQYDCVVNIDRCQDRARFIIKQHGDVSAFELDRSQAHLLMLYLQEHLASTIDKGLDDAITDELKHKPKDIMG